MIANMTFHIENWHIQSILGLQNITDVIFLIAFGYLLIYLVCFVAVFDFPFCFLSILITRFSQKSYFSSTLPFYLLLSFTIICIVLLFYIVFHCYIVLHKKFYIILLPLSTLLYYIYVISIFIFLFSFIFILNFQSINDLKLIITLCILLHYVTLQFLFEFFMYCYYYNFFPAGYLLPKL